MVADETSSSIHLRRVSRDPAASGQETFPFSVPIVRELDYLELTTPVSILVGENGSGKSTLLEAIACASRLPAVGSRDLADDPSLVAVRRLACQLRLTWSGKGRRGFFLRAEDFFGYARRLALLEAEAQAEIEAVDERYEGHSQLAKQLAKGTHRKTLGELRSLYGEGLDAQSHGESFLKLFQSRLVPNGLFLLDEPEAPLSPLRQLALVGLMRDAVAEGGQFLIATHSPIVMAYPGATLLDCDQAPLVEVAYDELESVNLLKSFLADPERFLRRL